MKKIFIKENKVSNGYSVWDDEKSELIGVIVAKDDEDNVDITQRVKNMISDEFNSKDVEFDLNEDIYLDYFSSNSINCSMTEDGEKVSRAIQISGISIY